MNEAAVVINYILKARKDKNRLEKARNGWKKPEKARKTREKLE